MTPQHLPLIVDVVAGWRDTRAPTGGDVPQTITVQLNSESGQVYLLPLSEKAAQRMAVGLLHWQPVLHYLRDRLDRDKG
jgi:hypothetical protein